MQTNERSAVVALADETRTLLTTGEAAAHLLRAPQTLRVWACRENGPIRPVRVGAILGWPTAEIRRLVGAGK